MNLYDNVKKKKTKFTIMLHISRSSAQMQLITILSVHSLQIGSHLGFEGQKQVR